MGRSFNFARQPGTNVPMVKRWAYTTGQTFKRGALVVNTTAGTVSECGADPAAVSGVVMNDAGSGPGYGLPNASNVVYATGRLQDVAVVMANRMTEFSARAVNGGTDPVVPSQTHIGEQYGVLKTAGGDWVIDMAETTAKVVEIVDITEDNFFLVKFLESVLTEP